MIVTMKAPKQAPSGSSKGEKGKTHASWPKRRAESVKVPQDTSQGER